MFGYDYISSAQRDVSRYQFNTGSLYGINKKNNNISKEKKLSIAIFYDNYKLDNLNFLTVSSINYLNKKTEMDNKYTDVSVNNKFKDDEYNNIIYYPSSTKEWFNSVYSYNKSYIKTLVTLDLLINRLFKSYLNMAEYRIKHIFKRRRARKYIYSSNTVHLSRAELKHTNTSIIILLYIHNRPKFIYEQYTRKLINFLKAKEISSINNRKIVVQKNRL